ncbi:hypothetical protein [Pseudotamlana carrageenivorans]|uniref:Uncharacterized protein n=1 Tax=Pseudotamlana carrageenivorans TaxID=2069432 RepID=A0A2I7SFP2_9FLAO|nr:hypothetical protein [Tamlana carrageenivorans]AUS04721.1 hypothetical protein C1A40_04180 [Tamlana carrageenivorans]
MTQLKLILTLTFLVALGCKVQQCIVPLEEFWIKGGEFIEENDCYAKDVNDILGKYVGVWRGDYNNKSYEFMIAKETDNKFVSDFKIDILLMKYLIKDSSGRTIENTTLLPDDDSLVIWGMYPSRYNKAYTLYYNGKNTECGQSGVVFIYSSGDGKMTLSLVPSRELINSEECVGRVVQILPTNTMMLTKQ